MANVHLRLDISGFDRRHRISHHRKNKKMKRLFLDIETCPCIGSFWRPGYNITLSHENIEVQARIITAAWKWQGDKRVSAVIWDEGENKKGPFSPFNQTDKFLVNTMVEEMNKADEIVAHYGDGFDVPWIRTRAMFHGIVGGVWKTVDTKAWASKYFVLPSNKLDAIAKYLGIGKKIRTEYDLWRDITFMDDVEALNKMVRYNKHDVDLLEKVFHYLSRYCSPHSHQGVMEGKPKWTCPRCGSANVRRANIKASAKGVVTHEMLCKDDGGYYMISNPAYNLFAGIVTHKRGRPRQ